MMLNPNMTAHRALIINLYQIYLLGHKFKRDEKDSCT